MVRTIEVQNADEARFRMNTKIHRDASALVIECDQGVTILLEARDCPTIALRSAISQLLDGLRRRGGVTLRGAAHVALVGLSGSGKSTLAPLLAARLGGHLVIDLDRVVERHLGRSVAEVFADRRRSDVPRRRVHGAGRRAAAVHPR